MELCVFALILIDTRIVYRTIRCGHHDYDRNIYTSGVLTEPVTSRVNIHER